MKRARKKRVSVERKSTPLRQLGHRAVKTVGLPAMLLPLIDGQGPVFEPLAKIGLLPTKNLDRNREAYRNAGAAEGLWEAA